MERRQNSRIERELHALEPRNSSQQRTPRTRFNSWHVSWSVVQAFQTAIGYAYGRQRKLFWPPFRTRLLRTHRPSRAMNIKVLLTAGLCCFPFYSMFGQGTFIYDQQSALENSFGETLADIQSLQPIGQSFTPSLSGIGFIKLYLSDPTLYGVGATVYLKLLSGSLTGAVLNSTAPVTLSNRFQGHVTFFFPNEVPLNAGTTYFFQPIIQGGESFGMGGDSKWNYTGGDAFAFAIPDRGFDFWFREGIIIPEPSSVALLLAGAVFILHLRRKG
jgi:hypothetical protein